VRRIEQRDHHHQRAAHQTDRDQRRLLAEAIEVDADQGTHDQGRQRLHHPHQ